MPDTAVDYRAQVADERPGGREHVLARRAEIRADPHERRGKTITRSRESRYIISRRSRINVVTTSSSSSSSTRPFRCGTRRFLTYTGARRRTKPGARVPGRRNARRRARTAREKGTEDEGEGRYLSRYRCRSLSFRVFHPPLSVLRARETYLRSKSIHNENPPAIPLSPCRPPECTPHTRSPSAATRTYVSAVPSATFSLSPLAPHSTPSCPGSRPYPPVAAPLLRLARRRSLPLVSYFLPLFFSLSTRAIVTDVDEPARVYVLYCIVLYIGLPCVVRRNKERSNYD